MNQRMDWTDPNRLFTNRTPTEEQEEKVRQINEACRGLVSLIRDLAPSCPERTLAERALHQCATHTNFAILATNPPQS